MSNILDPNKFIFELWKKNLERPILIIDEVRQNIEGQEVIAFCCVKVNAETALAAIDFANSARAAMGGSTLDLDFKGKILFGNRLRETHSPMRHYFFDSVTKIQGLGVMVTTNTQISASFVTSSGGLTLVDQNGVQTRVQGRETNFLNNFIKRVANDWGLGNQEADVIIDRSKQLGSDAQSRGIQENQFEIWGPGELNKTSDGEASEIVCETQFRYIQVSESAPLLRDLLLLPDAIGYLFAKVNAFNDVAKRISDGGLQAWVFHPSLLEALKSQATLVLQDAKNRDN